jgi:hypothetical protein
MVYGLFTQSQNNTSRKKAAAIPTQSDLGSIGGGYKFKI